MGHQELLERVLRSGCKVGHTALPRMYSLCTHNPHSTKRTQPRFPTIAGGDAKRDAKKAASVNVNYRIFDSLTAYRREHGLDLAVPVSVPACDACLFFGFSAHAAPRCSCDSSQASTLDRLNRSPIGNRKTGTGFSYLARPRRRVRTGENLENDPNFCYGLAWCLGCSSSRSEDCDES
jgi:hypothetical protein